MLIADGGGGEAPQAIPQTIFDSMNNFAKAAADGGFEVSAEGGDALIKAIERFQTWANGQSRYLFRLTQEPKLGTSNGAKVIAPFAVEVATDAQGFMTQLQALTQSLDKAKEGIEKAMANYRATDEASAAKANRTYEA
ncbi:hypothetical protein [Actinocrispum wychmicini]|uniref:PE family protein n=1 Tax=Actinocrispum wychmicini TaxID=1213861 RepID=A0A4R2K0W4_9PSEU|nr:hypothetical protein [Actinocrispum wychmicini]TCO65282.1 hypothetical protein EV192_1011070 [Actinocrispum wychmicini]